MNAAIYSGTISHERFIPRSHRFRYNFFMWFLPLDDVDKIVDLAPWFSSKRWALSRYRREDYLGNQEESHAAAVRRQMTSLTGRTVAGPVYGLLNLRTLGLYFSPVNFYFGYDQENRFSHFLAEVSNIPWNERHCYGYFVGDGKLTPQQEKQFHVSPFNPLAQHYQWHLQAPGETVALGLDVSDSRGQIFSARLNLARSPLTKQAVRPLLVKKPAMTAFIVSGIYYQAAKLFCKRVPYVPYQKEAI
jgi:DUF1365 family protein